MEAGVDARLIYTFLLMAVGLFAALLFVFILKKRGRFGGALVFCLLLAAGALYTFAYAAELWSGESLATLLVCTRIEYLGISFIPSLWFLFCLDYTGKACDRFRRALPFICGSLLFLAVCTMPLHNLYYRNPAIDRSGSFPFLRFERGPLYWAGQLYQWTYVIAGDLILLRFLRSAPVAFRAQILFVLGVSVFPLIMVGLYLMGFSPRGIDPNPFGFTLSFTLVALGLVRFHLFDLMPIARERVFEALEDGVLVVDSAGHFVDSNPAARRMLPGIELAGGPLFSQAIASLPEFVSFMSEPPPASAELSLLDLNGATRRYGVRSFPIGGGSIGGDVAALGKAILLTDISEAAALLAKMNELACTDELTAILNRRRFFEIARREVDLSRRSGRPFSVCIADLDLFKNVNDTYGHAAGDAVLREVARRFQAELRSTDVLCRYGGEEFALFFPDSEPEVSAGAALRIRARLAESPVEWKGAGISVSASFGVSGGDLGAEGGDALELALRQADLALYEAKEAGRNCVRVWKA